jgi:hypothetical protein
LKTYWITYTVNSAPCKENNCFQRNCNIYRMAYTETTHPLKG